MSQNWIQVLAVAFSCDLLDAFMVLACGADGQETTSCKVGRYDKAAVTSSVLLTFYKLPTTVLVFGVLHSEGLR